MVDAGDGLDWLGLITAVATAMTALAAWLAYRRERRSDRPIIERWVFRNGESLGVSFTIRNRLRETIVLEEVKVLSPSKATVTQRYSFKANNAGSPVEVTEPGNTRSLPISVEVMPVGCGRTSTGGGDTVPLYVLLWPPQNWKGRKIKLALRVSSKAGSFSNMKVVVKGSVPLEGASVK